MPRHPVLHGVALDAFAHFVAGAVLYNVCDKRAAAVPLSGAVSLELLEGSLI